MPGPEPVEGPPRVPVADDDRAVRYTLVETLRELDVEGVQFHPESFLTEHGHAMLRNWMRRLPPGSSAGGAPPAAREAVS